MKIARCERLTGQPTEALSRSNTALLGYLDLRRLLFLKRATIATCLLLAGTVVAQEAGKERRRDDPSGAAAYRENLQQDEQGAATPDAMPRAIARVRAMRARVAQRAEIAPAAVAAFAGRGGQSLRVGGIPVGPLPTDIPQNVVLLNALTPRAISAEAIGILENSARPRVLLLSATLNPTDWTWLGPETVGGRTRTVLVHPSNPQNMWVGGISGGVWRSTDAGVTWAPLNDFMASLVVSCMVLDPANPDILYVGTGEGFYNIDAFRGFGIFRSANGGLTWDHLEETKSRDFQWVNRLAISADGDVLLAGTRTGLFRSTDAGQSFERTREGSGSPNPFADDLLDVRFHPVDSDKCVAAGRNGKAWFSEDGGRIWTKAQGIPPVSGFKGRVELAYARADPDVVYAGVDRDNGEVYRSTDGGKTYGLRSGPRHLTHPGFANGQGWYGNTLWAGDPTDPNLLIIGGIDLHRSTNGGRTFTKISDWRIAPLSAHADHHVIVAHPAYDGSTNKTVFFGNDGGVYRATDVTTVDPRSGWQALNNGLGITQFYGAAVHPDSGRIVGGTQDNNTLLFDPSDGSLEWSVIAGGDGGYCAADPERAIFYGEFPFLIIHRSLSGAASKELSVLPADANDDRTALFIAPFILDPNDANIMLAGGASLWRTGNLRAASPAWTGIKQPLPNPGNSQHPNGLISAIAVAKSNSKIVWVGHELRAGHNAGAVFVTDEGDQDEPEWTRVGRDTLPKRHCTRIVIDSQDPNRVYTTFGGFSADNLWTTDDGGETWQSLAVGDLPKVPNYDLAIHPRDSNLLILGNEVGLFVSADRGQTWSPGNQGPTNCAVFELFWNGETLVSVTHGRGLFSIELSGHRSGEPEPPVFAVPHPKAVVD